MLRQNAGVILAFLSRQVIKIGGFMGQKLPRVCDFGMRIASAEVMDFQAFVLRQAAQSWQGCGHLSGN